MRNRCRRLDAGQAVVDLEEGQVPVLVTVVLWTPDDVTTNLVEDGVRLAEWRVDVDVHDRTPTAVGEPRCATDDLERDAVPGEDR